MPPSSFTQTMLAQNKLRTFAVATTFLLGLFYSPNLVFLILSLALLRRIISPMLKRAIFDSLLLRGILLLFVYIVLLESVILASWLVWRDFPLHVAVPITFAVTLAIYIFGSHETEKVTRRSGSFFRTHRSDLVAALMTLLIIVPAMLQTIDYAYHNDIPNPFYQFANGSDDSVHAGTLYDKIKYDRGILFESDAGNERAVIDAYPTGWHAVNAATLKAINPWLSINPHLATVNNDPTLYIYSKLFWVFVLVFVFCRTILIFTANSVKGKLSFLSALWLYSSMFILGRGLALEFVYMESAYTYTPQVISILLFMPIVLQLSKASRSMEQRNSLFLLGMLALGGSLSWALVLPASFATMVALLTLYRKYRHDRPNAIGPSAITRYAPPLLLLATAWAAQLYVMLASPSLGSSRIVEHLDTPGGLPVNTAELYILLLVGLTIYLCVPYWKYRRYFAYVAGALVPLLVLCLVIAAVQLITTGGVHYYFFKVVNLFVMMVLPLSIVGYTMALNRLEQKNNRSAARILFIVIFLISTHLLVRRILNILVL